MVSIIGHPEESVGTGDELLGHVRLHGAPSPFIAGYWSDQATCSASYAAHRFGWRVAPTPGGVAFPIEWAGVAEREVPSPAGDALAFISERTGLSQEQIGDVLGVTRQTLHNWRRGDPIGDANLRRLLAVRDVLGRAARRYPSPDLLRAWLLTPRGTDGKTPGDLLAAGEIDRARLLAMAPPAGGVSPLPAVLRRPTPPTMRTGRESRIEAYPDERAGASDDSCPVDSDEPAAEGWVE